MSTEESSDASLDIIHILSNTYSSRTTHIIFPYSYASYNWINNECCKEFIISTSRSTLRRSSRFGIGMNLAANVRPVDFSRHLYTVPNLPLAISNQMVQFDFVINKCLDDDDGSNSNSNSPSVMTPKCMWIKRLKYFNWFSFTAIGWSISCKWFVIKKNAKD